MGDFSSEEMNLITCFKGDTRQNTVSDMTAAMPYMEQDIQELVQKSVAKLNELTETEFAQYSFSFINHLSQ